MNDLDHTDPDSGKLADEHDSTESESSERNGRESAPAPSDNQAASAGEGQQTFKQWLSANRRNATVFAGLVIVGGFVVLVVMSGVFKVFAPPINPVIERSDELVKQGDQIQINLLNGCGEQGVARRTMDFMRSVGFDVVEIENYSRFSVQRSFVIDRVGDSVSALKTARALGIADTLCIKRVDSTLYVRCSVVLGRDYRALKPYQ